MIAGSTESRNICTHMLLCNLFSTLYSSSTLKASVIDVSCVPCAPASIVLFSLVEKVLPLIQPCSHTHQHRLQAILYIASLRPGKEIISLNGCPFFSTTIKICCKRHTQLESAIIRFIAECLCTELDSFWFAKKKQSSGACCRPPSCSVRYLWQNLQSVEG